MFASLGGCAFPHCRLQLVADVGVDFFSCWVSQVVTHMMPDLPNMGFERDLEGFREFFENPVFRPDGLKLYPTLVRRRSAQRALWSG
jgi:hypothetical protein